LSKFVKKPKIIDSIEDKIGEREYNNKYQYRYGSTEYKFMIEFFTNNLKNTNIKNYNKFVHKDIQLKNIGLKNDKIKILDLQTIDINNHYSYFVGSKKYASPESILDDLYYPKSDIYSLGVCMFRYLTGEFPTDYGRFNNNAESLENLRNRILNNKKINNISKYPNIEYPKIIKDKHNKIIFDSCKKIPLAFRRTIRDCLNFDYSLRPSLPRIYTYLRFADTKIKKYEFETGLGIDNVVNIDILHRKPDDVPF
jgi:serine/threonine protein kinase